MKEEKIIIEIDAEGRITADAEGFTGDACLKALDALLEGLSPGAPTLERKPDAGTSTVRRRTTQKVGRKG